MKALIAGAALICIVLIGVSVYFAVNQKDEPRLIDLNSAYTQRVNDGFWRKGATQPKVTLMEYGDFQCPGCGGEYPIIAAALEQTKDIAQMQFVQFPLSSIHDKANTAATASESAGMQGKFWEVHDLLFENQAVWKEQSASSFKQTLLSYARQLGLNEEQFKRDLEDGDTFDPVKSGYEAGLEAGIAQTPTLFINGTKLTTLPQTTEQLVDLIRKAAQP